MFKKRKDLQNSFKAVFDRNGPNSVNVKKVLEHLCRLGYVSEPTYTKGDSYETARREGARLVILEILKLIDIQPLEQIEQDYMSRDELY